MIESFSLDTLPEPPAENTCTVGTVSGTPGFPILTISYASAYGTVGLRMERRVDLVGSPPVQTPFPRWAWAAPAAGHWPGIGNYKRVDIEVEIEGPGIKIDWEIGRHGVVWPYGVDVPGGDWVYACNRDSPSDPDVGTLKRLVSYACQQVGDPRCDVWTRHRLVHQDAGTPPINYGYSPESNICFIGRQQMIIPRSAFCPIGGAG